MEGTQEVRLLLEATLDREGSISGSLTRAEEAARPFSGWLGLAAGITELARAGDAGEGGSPEAAPPAPVAKERPRPW